MISCNQKRIKNLYRLCLSPHRKKAMTIIRTKRKRRREKNGYNIGNVWNNVTF